MKSTIRISIPFIAIVIFSFFYYSSNGVLNPIDNYPIWMEDFSGNVTGQTSGLFYVGIKDGKKIFISCDDVGAIHRLTIDESGIDPHLIIDSIHFSKEAYDVIKDFRKKDFEESVLDKKNNVIYLSVEGSEFDENDPLKFKRVEGIYELNYNKDEYTFDMITSIRKMDLPPEIFEHTFDNIAIEGLAISDNYFFFGLENYQVAEEQFTDSTILYIMDRQTNEIKKINTRGMRISTICGLYAEDDFNLYGIDRNLRRAFKIIFNKDHTVKDYKIKEMNLMIPGHKSINMILGTSIESITLDDEGNIYAAVDPWSMFYMPDNHDKKRLTEDEIKKFKDLIPILYKFKNTF